MFQSKLFSPAILFLISTVSVVNAQLPNFLDLMDVDIEAVIGDYSVDCTPSQIERSRCNLAGGIQGVYVCAEAYELNGFDIDITYCAPEVLGQVLGIESATKCGCCGDSGDDVCPEQCICPCGDDAAGTLITTPWYIFWTQEICVNSLVADFLILQDSIQCVCDAQ